MFFFKAFTLLFIHYRHFPFSTKPVHPCFSCWLSLSDNQILFLINISSLQILLSHLQLPEPVHVFQNCVIPCADFFLQTPFFLNGQARAEGREPFGRTVLRKISSDLFPIDPFLLPHRNISHQNASLKSRFLKTTT